MMKNFLLLTTRTLFFMLVVFVSIQAHAYDYDFVRNEIYYTVTSTVKKTVEVTQSDTYSGDIVIPSTVTNLGVTYTVKGIGDYAFQECSGLTSVTIPESMTYIGNYAFENCGLSAITIPNGVTWIGAYAFKGCNDLTSITIPSSVTDIQHGIFSWCYNLTSIEVEAGNTTYDSRNNCNAIIKTATNTLIAGCKNTIIPNSVTSIYTYAFTGCTSLTSIDIPSSVTNIGPYAFSGCSSLTSINIPSSVTSIGMYAFEDCSSLTSPISIPNGVTSIDIGVFFRCPNLTSITIPNSVTSIKYRAFYGCRGLTSITIPNSVTSIGDWAFYGCSGLTSPITIPNSVTSIGQCAFFECRMTGSLIIPNSVTSIGNGAFSGGGLTSIEVEAGNTKYDSRNNCNAIIETATNTLLVGCNSTNIPDDVTNIGSSAFSGCSGLTSVTIPESVTSIGSSAFSGCSGLTSVTIPKSVTSIPNVAFQNCSGLTSVTIPNSVTSIGNGAFQNCSSLTSVTIPNSVTSIGYQTFTSSGLTSITIPNSVTSIGDETFSWCRSLISVTIPSSVSSIGSGAFCYCSNLKNVWCYAENVPSTANDAFEYLQTDDHWVRSATLHVPAASVESYRPSSPWSSFGSIVAIEGGEEPPVIEEPTVVIEVTDISQLNNAIYIEPFSARSGNTVSMDIRLKNNQDIAAYSFDLVLPEGVTLGKNAQNKFIYTLADDRHDEHSCTINEKSGNTYSVAVLSISGGEISGNDGTVVTLQAVMGENMEEGDYPVQIQNVMYSLPNGQTVNVPATQTALTIENVLVGDVNDNGTIDIGDAVCIVNHIVGKPNAVFVERAADVNGNGTAGEIGDAVSVVNIIVGKAMPQAARKARENRMNMLDPQ